MTNVQEERDELSRELKNSNVTTLSAEEKANRWDKIMKEEENRLAKLEQELQQLGELRFKKNEALNKEQHDEMVINAEIQGSQAAIKNLDSRLAMLDRESLKQQELIYTQVCYSECYIVNELYFCVVYIFNSMLAN